MKSFNLSLLTLTLLASSSYAATVGVNNTAGASAWADADDTNVTGPAFGTWSLVTSTPSGVAGFFAADSKDLDNGAGADINTSGTSFGLYGSGGGSADAVLGLTSDLLGGQALTFDLAVNFRNGNKGVDVRNSSDATIFNFNIGADDYVVNGAATGNGSTGDTYSADTAFNLSLTQVDGTGGTWTITRSGGVTDVDSGTFAGVVSSIKLYNAATDGGAPNDLYANSFTVVPEPSSAALLGLGGLALIFRRRK